MGKICEIAHNYEDQLQAISKEGVAKLILSGAEQKEIVSAIFAYSVNASLVPIQQDAAADRYFNGAFVKFMQYNEKALTDDGGTWFAGGKVDNSSQYLLMQCLFYR